MAIQEQVQAAGPGRAEPRQSLLSRLANLRQVLFVAFALLALIPVGILALWVQQSAYQKELDEVSERHLLLARNLSYAIDRYSQDAVAAFQLSMGELLSDGADTPHLRLLLRSMEFVHACIIDRDGRILTGVEMDPARPAADLLPDMSALLPVLGAGGDRTIISGVMPDQKGRPAIFLLRDLGGGRIGVGQLTTDYLVELQRAIAFGIKGHSALVDQHGRVLAHPNESWRLEMKDISKVSAVAKMKAGGTGVEQFFSPAMGADMIAGYTVARHTGWGVMVPQPIAELQRHAQGVISVSIYVGIVGFLVAVLLAWFLSRKLAQPIERVAHAARAAGGGNLEARLDEPSGATPNEIADMSAAFNQMLRELQISNERLIRAAEEAEAASKAKSHFMANMSHEFRTPLNAIMGYTDAMRANVFGPLGDGRYDDYADNVHDAGRHLLHLVEEILELTRIEAGRMSLRVAPINVADASQFAVTMLHQKAQQNEISVALDVDDDLPLLRTDESKLRQVLINLLSNAIKFTNPGGFARIEARQSEDWAVEIKVMDNGVGIDPADLPEVMKPYGQVASAFARSHGGTGLGLPLTQELVTLMGGTFELSPRAEGGTVATVRLPRVAPAASESD